MNTNTVARYAELRQSCRIGRLITFALVLNLVVYGLGHMILGGSALLAEPHEGESFIRPLHGDEFPVSKAVGWYSLLHGICVVLSLPSLAIFALMLLYEWARLHRLRKRMFIQS